MRRLRVVRIRRGTAGLRRVGRVRGRLDDGGAVEQLAALQGKTVRARAKKVDLGIWHVGFQLSGDGGIGDAWERVLAHAAVIGTQGGSMEGNKLSQNNSLGGLLPLPEHS
jgi:hypothetical protein